MRGLGAPHGSCASHMGFSDDTGGLIFRIKHGYV